MTLPPLHSKVCVLWIDIVTSGGWVAVDKIGDEVKAPEPCTTYGYLSYAGEDYLVVSHTLGINDPDEYNGHISIPLGCIKTVDLLT